MTHLAQQEAFEPAPSRRIIVPRGCEAHWGVDVGTRAVSVACVARGPENALERSVVTVPLHVADGGRRLAWAHGNIVGEIQHAMSLGALKSPGFVFVEQPGSSTINWPLAYMVGIAQSAAFIAAMASPTVETIPPSSWKKRAVGYGNIPKPTKKLLGRHPEFVDYPVAVWAREHGYTGVDWNEADAWAIAEAARRTVILEPR